MTSKHVSRWWKILTVLVLLSLTAMACSFTPGFSNNNNDAPAAEAQPTVLPQNSQPATVQLPAAVQDEQSVLINLYQRVNPSVVNITTYARANGELSPLGQGSGFVYDGNGHIVTNAHVVADSDDLDVIFWNGTTVAGKVLGTDLNSDLAVVQVGQIPAEAQPLPLADTATLAVGQTVVAIGNPWGLAGTLTRGIISALGRSIPALTTFSIPQAIQTDAPINPGNSGGPLLNLQGEVIGVNAQIETGGTGRANTGVGFAIPANIVQLVVPDLIASGEHTWAWLGVRGGTFTLAQAQSMQLDVQNGAYLSEIVAGGPAEAAGLRGSNGSDTVNGRSVEVGGDVIVAIDGQPVTQFDDVLIYVTQHAAPGQTVTLTILRDRKQLDVPVVLEPRPDTVE